MKSWLQFSLVVLAILVGSDCFAQAGTTTRVRDSSGVNMGDVRAEHYNGGKARIAVARFENKTANAGRWYNRAIGDGMADMLTTALVNSGRYIVLERESLDTVIAEQDLGASGRVRQDTAAEIGVIEGAELLVVAAVTEFEDNSGGSQGKLGGGKLGKVFGAVTGGSRKTHMAIDLRVIDAATSRILAATSVEGEAKDFNLGGALAGWTGSTGLGGSLSTWENTPKEKALRQVIGAAVEYVISVTPQTMLRYDSSGQPIQPTAPSPTASSGTSGSTGSGGGSDGRVVITANSLNVRQGPNGQSPVVFTLSSGNMVDVVVRAGDWMNVRNDKGQTGWISSEFALEIR